MPNRPRLSKRLRFEIFKRDHFACAYCGQTPPVILEVDHLVARANGGGDRPANLIAACLDYTVGRTKG